MKTIRKILCFVFGHEYIMEIKFSNSVQKLKCKRCGRKFGINHDVQTLLEWDEELENSACICYPEKFINK